jgi:hypothetical protein
MLGGSEDEDVHGAERMAFASGAARPGGTCKQALVAGMEVSARLYCRTLVATTLIWSTRWGEVSGEEVC